MAIVDRLFLVGPEYFMLYIFADGDLQNFVRQLVNVSRYARALLHAADYFREAARS